MVRKYILTIFILSFFSNYLAMAEDIEFIQARKRMVEKDLRGRGITDERVLAAMQKVPRHRFVDEKFRHLAYSDSPLPIGEGQTISQPYIVALMTQLLDIHPGEKVLEIGTGSGYQAAVLAELTDKVYSIEIIESLAKKAKKTLDELGYSSVKVKIGDGYFGWEEYAPYDAIIVTAASPHIPPPLVRQLKEGGRLIIPLEDTEGHQTLTLVRKIDGKLDVEYISGVIFVPMTGEVLKRDIL